MVRPTPGGDRALLPGQCRDARLRPGAAPRGPRRRRRPPDRSRGRRGGARAPRRGRTRAGGSPARSAGSWPSGAAGPARWPPRSPTCAAPPPRATAPPCSSPSWSRARSATHPRWSGCSATTSSGRSTGRRPALPADERDEAADVLADAAVGYWAAGVLPPLVRRELTGAYDRAVERGLVAVPAVGADLGPAAGELAALLDGVRELDEAGRAAWRTAVDEGRARAPALGHGHARGLLGGARLRAHPRPRDGAAARRPGLPRRRLRPARRRRRRLERRRRAASRAWPWATCSTRGPRRSCRRPCAASPAPEPPVPAPREVTASSDRPLTRRATGLRRAPGTSAPRGGDQRIPRTVRRPSPPLSTHGRIADLDHSGPVADELRNEFDPALSFRSRDGRISSCRHRRRPLPEPPAEPDPQRPLKGRSPVPIQK